jgi:hypothetical protein
MATSADGSCEDQTREIVPSDLLFVHEGLEEDGESWRATLPLAENLLRRVAVFPAYAAARIATDFRLDVPSSAPPAPHKHHHHRHTGH